MVFDIQVGNWVDIFCHPLPGPEVLHQADQGDEDLQHHHLLHSLFAVNKWGGDQLENGIYVVLSRLSDCLSQTGRVQQKFPESQHWPIWWDVVWQDSKGIFDAIWKVHLYLIFKRCSRKTEQRRSLMEGHACFLAGLLPCNCILSTSPSPLKKPEL